jgi:hypothetical protein
MEDDKNRKHREFQHNYSQELESEVFNKYRKSQDAENTQKQMEMQTALQKKQEYDNLQMTAQDRKKQLQIQLAEDYERSIRMKNDKSQYEKITDLQNGRNANDKASKELEYLQMGDNQKKKMIKEILNNDKLAHDGNKYMSYRDGANTKEQAHKDLELMEARARQRDSAFVSRYNSFNDFQNKTAETYKGKFLYYKLHNIEKVLRPAVEKDVNMHRILQKQEFEAKKKAEHDEGMK